MHWKKFNNITFVIFIFDTAKRVALFVTVNMSEDGDLDVMDFRRMSSAVPPPRFLVLSIITNSYKSFLVDY